VAPVRAPRGAGRFPFLIRLHFPQADFDTARPDKRSFDSPELANKKRNMITSFVWSIGTAPICSTQLR
jgi:hypothetical protein